MEHSVIQDSASLTSLSPLSISRPRLPLRCLQATALHWCVRLVM